MDFSRLRNGELAAGLGGIALFIFLFFDWYGGGGAFDGGEGLSGWDALGGDVTGFIVALTALAGLALAVLAAADRRLNAPVPRGSGTAALGTLSVAIILWRMLANDGLDLKVGIFLGLLAALAVAAGALIALREDGFEPLLPATGRARRSGGSATTRTARASARKPATRSGTRKTGSKKSTTGKRKSSSRSGGSRSRTTGTRRSGGKK